MRRAMFVLLRFSGVPFLARELIQRNRLSILCYHNPDPDVFAAHLEVLRRHYTIISLRQYIDWRRNNDREALPRKALVVTFDDGHRDNYRLMGMLERYAVRPTMFLCGGIAGTRRHFWWTAVSDPAMLGVLKTKSDEKRLAYLAKLGYTREMEYPDRQALSHDEIEHMKRFVDFQSHTRFHPMLPNCSAELAADEIQGSKVELENRFGLSVYALAYPNGAYTEREVKLARDAGYQCAITTEAGYNDGSTDIFRLRRLAVYDKSGVNELIVRASGAWGFLHKYLNKLGHNVRSMWFRGVMRHDAEDVGRYETRDSARETQRLR